MKKILKWAYVVVMLILPIVLWYIGIITHRVQGINIIILIVCTLLGWASGILIIMVINEDEHYKRLINQKKDDFQKMIEFYATKHTN
jgi:hypothetical protein